MFRKIKVAADGSGEFRTIQEALACKDDDIFISLMPGKYEGQIFSTKKRLRISGQSAENTIITGCIGAKVPYPDGNITGTFRTYTAYFAGQSVFLENLTIENTAGQGTVAGQAVALYASSSNFLCKNCRLLGYQDTLFTAPLPEKERLIGGFRGPEEHLPRRPSIQLYENCYISGTVDYIFGSADVLFKNCTLAVHDTSTECYITAPSTPKDGIGYIFDGCKIQKAEDYDEKVHKNVFLGRPWREYGKVCWLNSDFGSIICEAAWDNWGNPENEKTSSFCVYGNKWNHSGCAGKGTFAKELNESEALQMKQKAELIRQRVTDSCSSDA